MLKRHDDEKIEEFIIKADQNNLNLKDIGIVLSEFEKD